MLYKHCYTVWLQIIIREDSLYILGTDANTRGLLPGELPWLVESVNVAAQRKEDSADLSQSKGPLACLGAVRCGLSLPESFSDAGSWG